MAETLKLRILMDAVDKATAPLRRVQQAATSLRAPLGDAADRLRTLERTAGQVEKYRGLHTEVRRNADMLTQAKARAEALGKQLASTAEPTARLQREFAAARQQVSRAADAQQRSAGQLSQLRDRLAGAGVSTRNLAGDQRRLKDQIAAATAAAERQAAQVRRAASARQAVNDNRERRDNLRGNMDEAVAGAITLAAPIIAAVKFESVMADVKKVVNFDTPKQFAEMGDDILTMSTRIPMAADGIGEIVAAAGQAGIKRAELLRFTTDAAKMGVAFDMTGAEAGSAMTGLRAQFSLNQDGAVQLADAYNHLANNMDATGRDLLAVATRSAAAAQAFGLTGQQLGALGGTFLALKVPPEVAGTAITSMLGALQTAPDQSNDFKKALEGLGLSAEYMHAAIKRDAQGALSTFLNRVKQAPDPMSTLRKMFGENAKSVASLTGAMDIYKDALGNVADANAYAGSMEAEYVARSETTENALILLANRTRRLGITLGTILLPPLNTIATVLGAGADLVFGLAKAFPTLTTVVITATAGLIALRIATIAGGYAATFATGGWLQLRAAYYAVASSQLWARVQQAATILTTRSSALAARAHALASRQDALATTSAANASRARGWAAMEETAAQIRATAAATANQRASLLTAAGWRQLGAGAMQAAARGIGVATGAMRALTIATLTNPITWIAIAIAGAALLIYKYWQPLKAFFGGVWQGLREGLAPVWSAFTPLMEAAAEIKASFAPVQKTWADLKEAVAPITAAIRPLIDSFGGLFDQVQMGDEQLGAMRDTGVSVGRILGAGLRLVLMPLRALVYVVGTIAKVWVSVANAIVTAWNGIGDGIMGPVRLGLAGINLLIGGVRGLYTGLLDRVQTSYRVWTALTGTVIKALETLLGWSPADTVAAAWQGVTDFFDGLWTGIIGRAEAAFATVARLISSVRSLWPWGGDEKAPALPQPANSNQRAQLEQSIRLISAQQAPVSPFVTPPAQPQPAPTLRLVSAQPVPPPRIAAEPNIRPNVSANTQVSNRYEISIQASPDMDPQAIAREVRRQLEEAERKKASAARSAQYDRVR